MAAKKTTTKTTKKAPAKKAPAKSAKAAPAKKAPAKKAAAKKAPAKDKKMSAIDAAAKVLGEAKKPMTSKEMIERMAAKKYWTSPGGKTPHATLYSAILREIQKKGKDSRFKKADRVRHRVDRQFARNSCRTVHTVVALDCRE